MPRVYTADTAGFSSEVFPARGCVPQDGSCPLLSSEAEFRLGGSASPEGFSPDAICRCMRMLRHPHFFVAMGCSYHLSEVGKRRRKAPPMRGGSADGWIRDSVWLHRNATPKLEAGPQSGRRWMPRMRSSRVRWWCLKPFPQALKSPMIK